MMAKRTAPESPYEPGDHVWVIAPPGAPYGARILGAAPSGAFAAPSGARLWLDVNILGNHMPQMYGIAEIHTGLVAVDCDRLGICPDCLGFGDLGDFERVRLSQDLISVTRPDASMVRACDRCGGSGRRPVRTFVSHSSGGSSSTGTVLILPHPYVPPLALDGMAQGELLYLRNQELFGATADMCLACSMAKDAKNHDGEPVHGSTMEEQGEYRGEDAPAPVFEGSCEVSIHLPGD